MPRGLNQVYIIGIKDWVNGWEFLQCSNLSRPYCSPDWSWFLEEAQRFSQKRKAQRVLDQIKVNVSCQRAVLCPVVTASMARAVRCSR